MPETQPKNQHCMNCGHDEKWPDSYYCSQCGAILQNFCTNPNCELCREDGEDVELPADAKYCPVCGEPTLFFQKGYLKKDK